MKIRYLVSMGGIDQSFPSFEKDFKGDWVYYSVEDIEAVNLINLEYAVAEKEAEYKKAKDNLEKLKAEKDAAIELSENIKNLDEMKLKESSLKDELKIISEKIKTVETALKGK